MDSEDGEEQNCRKMEETANGTWKTRVDVADSRKKREMIRH